jgi:hypothetical protein
VLAQCIINIYRLFPPNLERPLSREALSDVQINLHAYVINLWGVFDNWAWIGLVHDEPSDFVVQNRGGAYVICLPERFGIAPQAYASRLELLHARRHGTVEGGESSPVDLGWACKAQSFLLPATLILLTAHCLSFRGHRLRVIPDT